ncbi:MAG: 30S ribosomal protein S7 [Deltaproteobacteria bacterium]
MPRRRVVSKRKIAADPKYGSVLVSKFTNCLMKKGKKSVARSILYDSLEIVGRKTNEDPLKVFEKAIENIQPIVEVKSRRVGGATYQVPVEVRPDRRRALAIRWIVGFARKRGEKDMAQRLAGELIDAFQQKGSAFKKREDTHRMAEANKAFAHYRW